MDKFQVGDVVVRIDKANAGGGYDCGWRLEVGTSAVVWEVTAKGWLKVIAKGVPMEEEHSPVYFDLVQRKGNEPLPARRNDPATSKAAAISIKAKRVPMRDTIIDLLDRYPAGLTGQEIAERTGFRLNSVTPRFAELRSANLIANSGLIRSGQIVWARVVAV